jgi:hypothetical protein
MYNVGTTWCTTLDILTSRARDIASKTSSFTPPSKPLSYAIEVILGRKPSALGSSLDVIHSGAYKPLVNMCGKSSKRRDIGSASHCVHIYIGDILTVG